MTPWDSEIVEALISIQFVGGKNAMRYVTGPLRRGNIKKKDDNTSGVPVINYGGPSEEVIRKHNPGVMPVSGISKSLLLSSHKLLPLSTTRLTSSTLELNGGAAQIDGTMLKAGKFFLRL